MPDKYNVVFVLGAPGSGKGTQCSNIVENFGYVHLSAGDLLRKEQDNPNSRVGSLIRKHIVEGTIVPVEITCALLEEAMKSSGKNDFLIDGFPRNEDNLSGWNRQMEGKVALKFILYFDCSQEACCDRCLSRGAAGSGREDDNRESLKLRFQTFMRQTIPIIEHYKADGMVRTIDASASPEQVFENVRKLFEDE